MRQVLIIAVILGFSASMAYADWSGATADRNISYFSGDSQSARYARIAKGPEGNLYIVWRQGGGFPAQYELYFGRSTDNGTTWSSETMDVQISANDDQDVSTGGDKPIGITTDALGNIYVVWAELLTDVNEIMLLKSEDQGVTWIHSDNDFNISYVGDPATNANDPDIAVDSNDNIYVVWHQPVASGTVEIHLSISSDHGETWSGTSADRVISYDNASNATNPDIAIDSNDNIYVVWDEMSDPANFDTYRIQYGKSTDGGETFNSETVDRAISSEIRLSGDADIVIDPSDAVHVTYQATLLSDPIVYEAFYTRSNDGGDTWSGLSGPQSVDFGSQDGKSISNQAMTVNSCGYLAVVWQEQPPGYSYAEIWASYSFDGGITWTGNNEPELLSFPDGHGAYNPDIVTGTGNYLHVIWNEGVASSGYYDIHYSMGDTLTVCPETVPTLSEWGMILLTLLMMGAGTVAVLIGRKRLARSRSSV